MATGTKAVSYGVEARSVSKGALVLLGRLFFALAFLVVGAGHFEDVRPCLLPRFTATLRQQLRLKPCKTEQNGSVATLFYQ
jgi:hypothetical protein